MPRRQRLPFAPFAVTLWKIKKLNKDKAITEDELHDGEDEVQKITDKYVKEIDDMAKKKEADIMEI